jgi:CubicO group peptidase (beta-lactamase class C family)
MRQINKKWAVVLAAVVLVAGVATFGPGGGQHYGHSAADVAQYVAHQRRDTGAPGSAVGVVRGTAASTAASGDVQPDTPFVIGSVTKSFTALAVMQLVEAGRVRVDEPVVTYLPYFATRNRAVSDTITVGALLSQTSGLSTAAGEDPFRRPATTMHEQVLALRGTSAAKPGTFTYSNANYEVLGELVEKVSGQSYGDYLQTHVLAPLDMAHTYTDLASAKAAGLKGGHQLWFGVAVPDGIYYRADWLPAGFLVSTVGDLNHFVIAMLNGGRYGSTSVLSAAGVRTLTTAATDASSRHRQESYGYGWFQERVGDRDLVHVPGSAHNYHADIVLVPDRHVGVVVLDNAESFLYFLIPKFDLVALNAAAIASDAPPQGTVRGLYLVIDVLLALMLFVYARAFVRVIRRRSPGLVGQSRPRRAFTVWRELVAPVLLVIELPRLLGFGWPVLIGSDLGLALAVVATLGIASMLARLFFFWVSVSRADRRSSDATSSSLRRAGELGWRRRHFVNRVVPQRAR